MTAKRMEIVEKKLNRVFFHLKPYTLLWGLSQVSLKTYYVMEKKEAWFLMIPPGKFEEIVRKLETHFLKPSR